MVSTSTINRNREIVERRFGIDYHPAKDYNIAYKCPFCKNKRGKADMDYKFYVDLKTLKFYCFKCKSKGRLRSVLESDYDVYNSITSYLGYRNDHEDDSLDDNVFYIPNLKIKEGTEAFRYLESRGFTKEHIDYYDMRLGQDDLFGRIVIPNELIDSSSYWTDMYSSRTFLDWEPKYKNPPGAKKTDVVFNIHRIPDGGDIYVMEGVLTAIAGGKESVAIYGCHPSNGQISKILNKNPKNIYCVLDNDEAGRESNKKLASTLYSKAKGSNVYLVYLPEGKDAADMGEIKFKEYVENNKILYSSQVYMSVASYLKK